MGELERLRLLSFLPQVRMHNMHNCEDSVLMKDGIKVIWIMCENTLNVYNSRKTGHITYICMMTRFRFCTFSAIVSTH